MHITESMSDFDVIHHISAYYQALNEQPTVNDIFGKLVTHKPTYHLPSWEPRNEA